MTIMDKLCSIEFRSKLLENLFYIFVIMPATLANHINTDIRDFFNNRNKESFFSMISWIFGVFIWIFIAMAMVPAAVRDSKKRQIS